MNNKLYPIKKIVLFFLVILIAIFVEFKVYLDTESEKSYSIGYKNGKDEVTQDIESEKEKIYLEGFNKGQVLAKQEYTEKEKSLQINFSEKTNSNKKMEDDSKQDDASSSIPEGFVILNQYIPDALYDIRYYSTFNFVGQRIEGYEAPVAIVTQQAADELLKINEEINEKGYRLKIFDAYRPQCAVDNFISWASDSEDTKMKEYFYPKIDKSTLFKKGYVSKKSGHSRGSTVDLTLFDMKTGCDVDMGSGFDLFDEISHANYTSGLTKEQINNRAYLRDVMRKHGFNGITSEWWHFTLINEPYPNEYFNFVVTDRLQ